MSTVKSVVFLGEKKMAFRDEEWKVGPLAADEVEGRTLVTLVSPGTELNSAYERKRESPAVGGYAAVIELDAVGPGVKSLRVGDRVFVKGAHRARERAKENEALRLPDGLAPEVAVFCRMAGVSWTTLVTTNARPADRVAVFGLGLVGNLAAQLFQSAGYRVTAVDPSSARRDQAKRYGIADVREKLAKDDPLRGQVALAMDCAGHELAVLECCKVVRKGGEVVVIGVPWKQRCDLCAHELLFAVFHNYVNLRSGWEWELPLHEQDFRRGDIYGNFAAALQWLADGRLKVDGMATVMSPKDAQAAYDGLCNASLPTLTVVFDWTKA